MPLNSFGNTPPIVDPEKRKIAAQKSTLTRQIHSLEIAVRQLETTGPEAVSEIEKLQKELWHKKVERNALDGLPPPPEPMINEVSERASPHYAVEDAEEGVQRRIGTQNKKKMDPYSEAMKEMEDEYDRVEGAKLQEQEEEKIDEALDHLIGEYEKKDKRSRVKPSVSVNKTSSIPEAPVVNTTPPEAPVADATAPQTPEAVVQEDSIEPDKPQEVEETPLPVPDERVAEISADRPTDPVQSAAETVDQIETPDQIHTDDTVAADASTQNGGNMIAQLPLNTESTEASSIPQIKDVTNFSDLFRAIEGTHGIKSGFAHFEIGQRGQHGSKGFRWLIEEVGAGRMSLSDIPPEYGIRDKVTELIAQGEQVPPRETPSVDGATSGGTAREAIAQNVAGLSQDAETISVGEAAEVRANYDAAVRVVQEGMAASAQADRARSWWARAPQATRDAALFSILKADDWMRNRSRWGKVAVVGGIAAILAYMYIGKNWDGEPDLVQYVPQRGTGSSGEQSRSFFDQVREWFRGTTVSPDTMTVGPEVSVPASASPEVVSGVFEHVVKKGDTVWSIVQHMLPEKFPASVFAKLGPEQVAYITDGLKDALERMTPQQLKELGISSGNIGKIFPGDTINFSKLFENQTLLNDLLEKARGLTQDQIQNIARNIRLGRM